MISWACLSLLAALNTGPFLDVLSNEASDSDPGLAAVVIMDGEAVFAGARGLADIESGQALSVDTPMYAGSLSKVFTAVVVMKLVENGDLVLDEPVDFGQPPGQDAPFNVRSLLSHASGLPREGNFGYWFSGEFPGRSHLREYVTPLLSEVRSGGDARYSNIGYAVIGLAAEKATGRPFESLLREMVTQPLGMTQTGAPGPAPDIARGYSPPNRLIPSRERPFAGVGRKIGNRHLREYHDAKAMTPAFGIYTSARDLGKLAQLLIGDEHPGLLAPVTRARMREAQDSGWGLGIGVGSVDDNRVATHSGWFAAHRSFLLLDAGNGIGVAVLANSDDGVPARVARALYRVALSQRESSESDK